MMDPVRELKIRAEILQDRVASGDAASLERLRVLPEMRRAEAGALAEMGNVTRRKHCLAVVARECGFGSWEHARRVLEGDPGQNDLGSLLYEHVTYGGLHPWFASYEEARAFVDGATGGPRLYLLAFRRHFFVCERDFVLGLGLDPDDADWRAIGWDWGRPRDPLARRRLYGKRLAATRGAW